MTTFSDLWLSNETLDILKAKGYETPSPIQEQTIPLLLNKVSDIIWQSQTGTGKTAAFGLPVIENLLKNKKPWDKSIKALILTPTRELAIQVWSEIKSFIWKRNLSTFTIYGWQSYITEKRHIKDWIDILVWTPGRIIDHMNNKVLDFSNIQYFILDEADEMLNMGFIDDIQDILKNCPKTKTTLFFSATMPDDILRVAKKYMNDYQIVTVKTKQLTTTLTDQCYYLVKHADKFELLVRLLDAEYNFYWIVFCKTKSDVDWLVSILSGKWYNVDSLHGDISQSQREKTIKKFKEWNTKILIATDVAARGLDINNLSHVINFTIPQNAEDYTHRIWRTWRAWKKWVAITFVSPMETKRLESIKHITKWDIQQKEIPSVASTMSAQMENMKKMVGEMIDANNYNNYLQLAHDLLKLDKAEVVLWAILAGFLKDKLLETKYWDIAKVSWDRRSFSSREWSSAWGERLFIAQWRKAWYSPRKLVDFIFETSGVRGKFIDDVQVMDDFSFFSVSKQDAEKIVKSFSRIKGSWKSLVSYAKKK